MMVKIVILQAPYSLSGEAAEFYIKDGLSFQRFLGIRFDNKAPEATTLWPFRYRLVQAKAIDKLFARFDAAVNEGCYPPYARTGEGLLSQLKFWRE